MSVYITLRFYFCNYKIKSLNKLNKWVLNFYIEKIHPE